MWDRFTRRVTSLAEERGRYGFRTNGPIRNALIAHAGLPAYRAAIRETSKRGRKPAPPPPPRRTWHRASDAEADGPVGTIVEVPTHGPRVVLVQRIGHLIRLTSAERVQRTQSEALRLGGTVLLSARHIAKVWAAIQRAANDNP